MNIQQLLDFADKGAGQATQSQEYQAARARALISCTICSTMPLHALQTMPETGLTGMVMYSAELEQELDMTKALLKDVVDAAQDDQMWASLRAGVLDGQKELRAKAH